MANKHAVMRRFTLNHNNRKVMQKFEVKRNHSHITMEDFDNIIQFSGQFHAMETKLLYVRNCLQQVIINQLVIWWWENEWSKYLHGRKLKEIEQKGF